MAESQHEDGLHANAIVRKSRPKRNGIQAGRSLIKLRDLSPETFEELGVLDEANSAAFKQRAKRLLSEALYTARQVAPDAGRELVAIYDGLVLMCASCSLSEPGVFPVDVTRVRLAKTKMDLPDALAWAGALIDGAYELLNATMNGAERTHEQNLRWESLWHGNLMSSEALVRMGAKHSFEGGNILDADAWRDLDTWGAE